MPRSARAASISTAVFVSLIVLLGAIEGGLELEVEDTNRLGVLFVGIAAMAAAAAAASQVRRGATPTILEVLAVVGPPCVLAWVIALFSGAGTVTNVAIAAAGPAGAALGVYVLRAVR